MAFDWRTGTHRYSRYFTNISRFYRQKKVRVYTEIVLSILTVCFFLFFAIKPTLLTIAGLKKELEDKKLVTQKLEEKINNLNIAQQEYFNVQNDLYLVDQSLPKNSQISILIKQIEALASRASVYLEGVQYSSIGFKEDNKEEKLREIEFKMVSKGNYKDLKNFLLSLNNFRRIIKIEGFGLKTGITEGELMLSVDGKSFFLGGVNE